MAGTLPGRAGSFGDIKSSGVSPLLSSVQHLLVSENRPLGEKSLPKLDSGQVFMDNKILSLFLVLGGNTYPKMSFMLHSDVLLNINY